MRLTDNVLIRMPNEAFKLNTTAARIVSHILNGGSVQDFITVRSDSPDIESQLEQFFIDFVRVWNNEVCDEYRTDALRIVQFSRDYIELPILSEVALTSACNIKCRFCYAGCTQKKKHAELDTEGFKKVLDTIRHDAEVPSVSFTGGEPLLFDDLPELIHYASAINGMRVNLITNGTLITPQKARELAHAGLSSAQVSIESANPSEHDVITGVPGSHQASVAGFKALMAADILVHPHFTLCAVNQNSVAEYPEFCKKLGSDRFSANLVIPAGRGQDMALTIRYSEVGPILAELQKKAFEVGVQFMWYSPTPLCLFNPIAAGFGNKGCSACQGLLSVNSEGNVLPCSSWNEPIGDLLQEGFVSIWYKKRAQWIRAKEAAPLRCRPCIHFEVCQGACPLYFAVHGDEELHTIWESSGLCEETTIV
jgi:radical SAM protein with 4Fe4S-binding SPASM domain